MYTVFCNIRKLQNFLEIFIRKYSALILPGLHHLHTNVAAHPLAQLIVWHAFNNWPFNCRQMKSDVK